MDNLIDNMSSLFLGNGVIIILGCFVIGTVLKGSIKGLPNKYIPYINILVAIVLGFLIPGTYEEEPIVSKIILLSFLGLASVGVYEALCIVIKDRFSLDIKQLYNNIINSYDNDLTSNQTDEVNQDIKDNEEDIEC